MLLFFIKLTLSAPQIKDSLALCPFNQTVSVLRALISWIVAEQYNSANIFLLYEGQGCCLVYQPFLELIIFEMSTVSQLLVDLASINQ
jgi:hypothetical protein